MNWKVTLCVLCAVGQLATLPVLALPSANNEQEAAAFFKSLLEETDNPIIADLAKQSLRKLSSPEATSTTKVASLSPATQMAPADIVENVTPGSKRQVVVPFMSGMRHGLAVPVMLNSSAMGTFLVDTGATYTVISPRMAQKLGVTVNSDNERITILTANGRVSAPMVKLDRVRIGGVEVRNVKALVQDFGNNDVLMAGVLGMNVFKNMDLTIKRDRMILSFDAS